MKKTPIFFHNVCPSLSEYSLNLISTNAMSKVAQTSQDAHTYCIFRILQVSTITTIITLWNYNSFVIRRDSSKICKAKVNETFVTSLELSMCIQLFVI